MENPGNLKHHIESIHFGMAREKNDKSRQDTNQKLPGIKYCNITYIGT